MIVLRWILMTLQFAQASVVVLPAQKALESDYEAFMAAHQEFKTPEQVLRGHSPSSADSPLLKEFADAQTAFISPEPKLAIPIFERLLNKVPDSWSASERSILFQSAMRLAQLETGANRIKWLMKALSQGPDQIPDAQLFPPPLVQEWEELRNKSPKISVQKLIPFGWKGIQIQGAYYDLSSDVQIPITSEPVHLKWISNLYQPFTAIQPLFAPKDGQLPREAWVTGECRRPEFSESAKTFSEKKAFFNLDCVDSADSKPKELKLGVTEPKNPSITMFAEPKTRPIYKSPWFWAGVGAAVLVAIAVTQRKSESEKEPSTTYGY